MAQTGYTPISIYYSATATNTPTAGNLVAGELAINTADGKLFYKDSSGVVQTIAGKGGAGVAGGSTTQVQYNSSGSLAGSANMTFSGTALTLANDASISGLTVGKGSGTTTQSTAIGNAALSSANTVGYNTALGYFALQLNTSGANNTAVGNQALNLNTSGVQNTGVGSFALLSNTTGGSNNALGQAAMYYNTTGANNTAIGQSALQANTTASNNTAVGYQAGYSNTTGTYSTYVGYQAGLNATGGFNTGFGEESLKAATGILNTAIGASSGYLITSGSKNSILGAYTGNQGGLDIRTASNYIVLSDGDGNPRGICNGSGQWGFNGSPQAGNIVTSNFVSGSYGFAAFYGSASGTGYFHNFAYNGTQVGTISSTGTITVYATTSDYRLKENVQPMTGALATVAQLKPVTYDWINDKSAGQGFIAHELQAVIPDAVVGTKDAVNEDGKPIYQQIDTSVVVATLTAAIQELKTEVDSLKQQLASK